MHSAITILPQANILANTCMLQANIYLEISLPRDTKIFLANVMHSLRIPVDKTFFKCLCGNISPSLYKYFSSHSQIIPVENPLTPRKAYVEPDVGPPFVDVFLCMTALICSKG